MITDQEKLNMFVMNAYHREIEVHSYQVNIDNYTFMLENLPQGDWDEDISLYRNTPLNELPHSLTDEQVQRYIDFNYRDHLRFLVRSEKSEQSKSIRVRDALKNQIGDDYDALLQEYKATQV
jgi:hypothetical protein